MASIRNIEHARVVKVDPRLIEQRTDRGERLKRAGNRTRSKRAWKREAGLQ